jgi:NitT/TauT family transport system substrate-binding protein
MSRSTDGRRNAAVRFYLCLLGSFFLALGKTDGADLPKIRFVTHWYAQPEDGGFYTAALRGYWREEGIEVEIVQGGPNSEIEKHVSVEPNTLGIARGEQVLVAVAHGLPLTAIENFFQHDPQGIMVRADSPVHSFADLNGKTIAVTPGVIFMQFLAKKYHLDRARTVPYAGTVANFLQNADYIQQAFPTSEPFYAARGGVQTRMLMIYESGFDPYRCVVANDRLLSEHPDWLRAFNRAAYRGWIEFFHDPQPALTEIQKENPLLDAEGIRFGFEELKKYRFIPGFPEKGESFGKVDAQRWDALGKQLVEMGLISELPDLSKVYTDRFTPDRVGIAEDQYRSVF